MEEALWLNLRPGIYVNRQRKIMKNLAQDIRFLRGDLNEAPPGFEVGVPSTTYAFLSV
jgi:hypothetical protein